MGFEFRELGLKGVFLVDVFSSGDQRGKFTKFYEKDLFLQNGLAFSLNEMFISTSSQNVIRGIHFQICYPQAKIVSVLSGAVWDVIVDLRPDSCTYKKWISVVLRGDEPRSVYIPQGFGHGFASLEDNSIICYQCDGKYYSEYDSGIRFDDMDIGIKWPIGEEVAIHSKRDLKLMSFREYDRHPIKILDSLGTC